MFGNRCAEIEDLENKHHSRRLHEEVKRLTDRKSSVKTSSGCINNKDGTLLFENDDIEKRWVEYISELYKDDERGQIVEYIGGGPEITEQEVIKARKKMKDKKAAGMDGINTEIIKALDGASLRTLTKLCNKIYSTGYIPDDMMNSVFITLPKKPKAINCTEFRTISLMSHIMKLLRIILDRIDAKIESEIDDCQSGFRPGKGTREGIFNLKKIMERCMEEQKDVFVCFIDYEKAFGRVYHSKIMQCMETIDIDENDKRLIGNLYWNQQPAVRLESGISTLFPIKRGVRQGYVLSPKLFNLYTELIFRKSIEIKGCVVGGVNINNLQYADDTALIAES